MRIKIENIDVLNYHIDRLDDSYDKGLINFYELQILNIKLMDIFNKIMFSEVLE